MYLVARKLGEATVAKRNLDKAMDGFAKMIADPNLDAFVQLNRLKRGFLHELWEGESTEAFRIATEALAVARGIRDPEGTTDRWNDTTDWIDARIAERYGTPAEY